jgi:hypothetical protein
VISIPSVAAIAKATKRAPAVIFDLEQDGGSRVASTTAEGEDVLLKVSEDLHSF